MILKNKYNLIGVTILSIFFISFGLVVLAGGGGGGGGGGGSDADFASINSEISGGSGGCGNGPGVGGGGGGAGGAVDEGQPCESAPNNCGQTSSGTIQHDGSCSAITPPDTSCPPIVRNEQVAVPNYCLTPPIYGFSWEYYSAGGVSQSSYSVEIDDDSDFSSALSFTTDGLNNPSPTTNSETAVVSTSPVFGQLAYNTNYYIQIMVEDLNGESSGWLSGTPFTTQGHPSPSINFSQSPIRPSAGEDTQFIDLTNVFGGTIIAVWSWIFEDGIPPTSSLEEPMMKFNTKGEKQVTLQVTDSDGYSCSESKPVNIADPLPGWKEIIPR